jgi:hypothetical protein
MVTVSLNLTDFSIDVKAHAKFFRFVLLVAEAFLEILLDSDTSLQVKSSLFE